MIFIIAYGNSLRGDDGAGLVLGEMLEKICRERQIVAERMVCHQLTPELVVEMVRPEVSQVVFTDTRVAAPGGSGLVEGEPVEASNSAVASGHHLGPATLLLLAEKLYQRNVRAWQITVPGIAFDHGELLSRIARRALEQAPPLLESFLDRVLPGGDAAGFGSAASPLSAIAGQSGTAGPAV